MHPPTIAVTAVLDTPSHYRDYPTSDSQLISAVDNYRGKVRIGWLKANCRAFMPEALHRCITSDKSDHYLAVSGCGIGNNHDVIAVEDSISRHRVPFNLHHECVFIANILGWQRKIIPNVFVAK